MNTGSGIPDLIHRATCSMFSYKALLIKEAVSLKVHVAALLFTVVSVH